MITLRPAQPDDAEALTHLAESTFRSAFSEDNNLADMESYCTEHFSAEIQRQEILEPNCATLLAESDGELIAFARVRLQAPKDGVVADHPTELHRLYVKKAWHGQGVAHQLMAQILSMVASAGADYIWLGVWEDNPRAIAFYRKYGFDVVGEHIFQLGQDPQRDLVMAREIDARGQ